MKVTVGIPTRNRAELVSQAVQSVLAQTHTDLEIVISDNASTDDTVARLSQLRDPRVVLLRQETNIGMAGNWSACLAAATGELFLLLSDDDLLDPGALEALHAPFVRGAGGVGATEIGVAYCPSRVIDIQGRELWKTEGGPAVEPAEQMLPAFWRGERGVYYCAVLVRTSDARIYGYDWERFEMLVDLASWMRIALLRGHVACADRALACYRLHSSNTSVGSQLLRWQTLTRALVEATVQVPLDQGRTASAESLRRAGEMLVSNAVVTAALHAVRARKPVVPLLRDLVQVRDSLFTRYIAERVLRDARKLGRFVGR
ncbi:MAG TPA: glycosyltransferase family 2 protein [Polyangiales bacterium]|nr:glycosyltransferase family 2 protein [Polyangiales bacterium]